MAIAFRQKAIAGSSSGVTSVVLAVPTGTVDGDVMVAVVELSLSAQTVSTPSGWTALDSANTGPTVATFRKVAASEPANYTFSWSGSAVVSGSIASYSGCNTSAPVNAHGALNRTVGSTTVTANSVTTSVDGCMVLFVGGINTNSAWTGPTSYTQRAVPQNGASAAVIAEFAQTSAGAVGSIAATASVSGNSYGGLIALAPPASASTASPGFRFGFR